MNEPNDLELDSITEERIDDSFSQEMYGEGNIGFENLRETIEIMNNSRGFQVENRLEFDPNDK